ncbi:hypothetical protein HanRHA438_Chr16g0762781 [Helianthus annuus]|nr:hypothetical protein HanRHA438_Chr16g0762781 [Helianthus annuus]
MEELRLYNIEAYKWLASIPPIHWSRSHFTGRARSDVVLNNMCEVLNARTVNGLDKPIISALEFVREYLMQRIVNVLRKIRQTNGPLTPRVAKIFENTKKVAANYNIRWSGGTKYQVSGKARNPGRRADTPEEIHAEKGRFKGMDEFPSDGDQACCQEPNTRFEASALNITMSRTLLCCKHFC